MRNPGGYLVTNDPDPTKSKGQKATVENDTFTCAHCGCLVTVKPLCDPADMGGRCTICSGLVCKRCHGIGRCDPFEEKLKRQEAAASFRRDIDAG